MRLTFGILGLMLLLYVAGAGVVSGRGAPVRHVWSGEGRAPAIHFSMPSGPLPGVLSQPWALGYRFSCTGVKPPPGGPPNTSMNTTMSLTLNGVGPLGGGLGMSMSDARIHGVWSAHYGDGGSYTLRIDAKATCKWTVSAASR